MLEIGGILNALDVKGTLSLSVAIISSFTSVIDLLHTRVLLQSHLHLIRPSQNCSFLTRHRRHK